MAENQLEFEIPEVMDVDELRSSLQGIELVEEEQDRSLQRDYYDTFDWRVYLAGAVLEGEGQEGGGVMLAWRLLSTGEQRQMMYVQTPPRFAWDLSRGPLRTVLEGALEMRALMLQARIRTNYRMFKLLNRDDKTVARVCIEENVAEDPATGKSCRIGAVLRVVPVKGYRKPLKRILHRVEEVGLPPAAVSFPLRAFEVLNRRPGEYTSKLNINLDPNMRADQAAKVILLDLLVAMEVNEKGTAEDVDSEFLHDFRVAVRRTRSALTQIKGVFPEDVLQRFRDEFAWLGQITGPTRDMDVYLLMFDEYRASLPVGVRKDLDPLRTFLQAHQQSEQMRLSSQLLEQHFQKTKRDWRAFLESEVPARSPLPNAMRPVFEVASERIWRIYRRVIKEGQAITSDSPATELHELRKTCKKLRYLMEFFQSLYDSGKIRVLVKALKTLQENLGDFQDFEVQASSLRAFSQQMMDESRVPAETLMAMGVLTEGLIRRQHRAREEFAARFQAFASPDDRALFRELFAPHFGREAAAA